MLDQRTALELFALVEYNSLRAEAMDLFERCLMEGTPQFLEHFVQQQLIADPPRLDLLLNVAEDVHQRLMTLRESLFDVRNQLLARLLDEYGVDISHFAPANSVEDFHRLQPHDLLGFIAYQYPDLSPAEVLTLERLFRTVLLTAAQLYGDIVMSRLLLNFILDWADSVSMSSIRHVWRNNWEPLSAPQIH